VFVKNGELQFNPRLLRNREFLDAPVVFKYTDITNQVKEIELEKGSLCFTYCQIPIVYKLSEENQIKVVFNNGETLNFDTLILNKEQSQNIFSRTGKIEKLIVSLNK